jgi:hypothetical protein
MLAVSEDELLASSGDEGEVEHLDDDVAGYLDVEA